MMMRSRQSLVVLLIAMSVAILAAQVPAYASAPDFATGAEGKIPGVTLDDYLDASSSAFGGVTVSPDSQTAYLTVPSENEVAVLNLASGTFGTPIPVGSEPKGIDITPDGSTLYVCDSGGQTISVVNTSTEQVTNTIITPPSFSSQTPWQIAIGDNNTAIFTTTFAGSGFGGHAYLLNLSSDAITVASAIGISGQVTEATYIARSANYSTAAVVLGDDSGGPVYIYSFGSGTAVDASLSEFLGFPAVDGTGDIVAVNDGDDTYVLQASSAALLGTISGGGDGLAINQGGTVGYSLNGSDVQELNLPRYLAGSTIPLPMGSSAYGQMVISPDDSTLVAIVSTGVAVIDLAPSSPPTGTPETPMTLTLPVIGGGILLGGGVVVARRRRRMHEALGQSV